MQKVIENLVSTLDKSGAEDFVVEKVLSGICDNTLYWMNLKNLNAADNTTSVSEALESGNDLEAKKQMEWCQANEAQAQSFADIHEATKEIFQARFSKSWKKASRNVVTKKEKTDIEAWLKSRAKAS